METDVMKEQEKNRGVDIMAQLQKFPEAERRMIVSETAAIQLNGRCKGNCPFCMYGENTGSNNYYTYDSLTRFITEYGPSLSEWPLFYHHSDVFDWRDGEHSFLDLYKKMRDVQPEKLISITTAVNAGGENNFREFLKYTFTEFKDIDSETAQGKFQIVLSIGRHNQNRVEGLILSLEKELLEAGNKRDDIYNFFQTLVKKSDNNRGVYPIGRLIQKQDKVRDLKTPACNDGVLMTPDGVKAILVNLPTGEVKSGVWEIGLTPGNTKRLIPKRKSYYSIYRSGSYVYQPATLDGMLPLAKPENIEGNIYQLPNKEDHLKLHLGRVTALALRQIDQIATMRLEKGANTDRRKIFQSYLLRSAGMFREQESCSARLIKEAVSYSENTDYSKETWEQVGFYIKLAEVYQKEMAYLTKLIEANRSFEEVAVAATVIRQIGEKQVENLEGILEQLEEFDEQILNPNPDTEFGDNYINETADKIVEFWGNTFGIKKSEYAQYPKWVQELAVFYHVRKRLQKRHS